MRLLVSILGVLLACNMSVQAQNHDAIRNLSAQNGKRSLDTTKTISINFGDTTIFSSNAKYFALGWQWTTKTSTVLNKRLNVNYAPSSWHGWLQESVDAIPDNHPVYWNWSPHVLYGDQNTNSGPYVGLALEWHPAAPKYINLDSFTPREGDTTGAVFGFRSVNYGRLDTIVTSKNFMNIVLEDSSLHGYTYPLLSFNRPDYDDQSHVRLLRTSNLISPDTRVHYDSKDSLNDTNNRNGTRWYLTLHIKPSDSIFTARDTAVVASIRVKWFTYRGSGNTRDSGFIHFDSLLSDPSKIQKSGDQGYCDRSLQAVPPGVADTVFVIRRNMLRNYSGNADSDYVTVSAFLSTHNRGVGGSTLINPLFPLKSAWTAIANQNDIDSVDIQFYYHGGVNVAVDWIRMETPFTRALLRGSRDSMFAAYLDDDIRSIKSKQIAYPLKKFMISNIQGLDEVDAMPYFWRFHRYISGLFDYRLTTEAGSLPAYMHSVKQKVYWTGYNMLFDQYTLNPIKPRKYASSDPDYDSSGELYVKNWMDRRGGWVDLSPGESLAKIHECRNCGPDTNKANGYGFPSSIAGSSTRRPSNTLGLNSWGVALCGEEQLHYYLGEKNTRMLYGAEPWYDYFKIHTLYEYGLRREPRDSVSYDVFPLVFGNIPYWGESLRKQYWLMLILGCKGFVYDGFHCDQAYSVQTAKDSIRMYTSAGWDTLHFRHYSPTTGRGDTRTLLIGSAFPLDPSYRKILAGIPDTIGTTTLLSPEIGPDYYTVDTDSLIPSSRNHLLSDYLKQNVKGTTKYIDSIYKVAYFKPTLSSGEVSKVYLGSRSIRYEMMKMHDFVRHNESELLNLDLMAYTGKGFNFVHSCRDNDTSLYSAFVDMRWNATKTREIGAPVEEQWDTAHVFVDVTLLRDHSIPMDSVFYVGVLNRHSNALVATRDELGHLVSDSLYYHNSVFYPSFEFDSMSTGGVTRYGKYDQYGSREISVALNYQPPFYDQQGRLLHVVEMTTDSSQEHIDTVICQNCRLGANYQPGQGRLFRVTLLHPVDRRLATGSLDFANQRKIVAMPIWVPNDTTSLGGSYDSTRVRYHVVFHRLDTLITTRPGPGGILRDSQFVYRVYYKRSKIIERCSPMDVNPLNVNDGSLWDTTLCVSENIKEYTGFCVGDSVMTNKPCMYPSIVVRYDSVDRKEYVYIVYNCRDPYPTHPKPSFVSEAQFVSSGHIPSPASRVIDRFGADSIEIYGHATVNASRNHNFYAWSTHKDGIKLAARMPTLNDTLRCPRNDSSWRWGVVSWNPPNNGFLNGADCRHPSLNTYSRLDFEDSCSLVWEEKRLWQAPDTARPYDDWHIYYTNLSVRNASVVASLPPYRGGDPAVFDTNSSGTITRISKWITNRRGFSEHHLPSVMRNMTVQEPTWRADIIAWAGQGAYSYVCGPTPSNAHGIFILPMWADRDSLFCVGNHAIWSCSLALNRPSITWSTSFTQDSDVVIDFTCPADGYFYSSDMIFNFGKRYFSFTAPMNVIEGGNSPHLSAQPIVGSNIQWKQMRRIYNSPSSNVNPPILSSVTGLFKASVQEAPYTAYPLVGYENADGAFTICDLLDDGSKSTMHALFPHDDRKGYNPSDTVYSEWFPVNDKRALHFVLNGEYTGLVKMFLQNKRTGLLAYVDLDQLVIDSTREVRIGRFDVLNGGGDDYKILLTKRDTTAKYVENVYIDNRLKYLGKTSQSSEPDRKYEVDLGTSSGLTMDNPLLAYPNPAEESLFIGVAHQSKRMEAVGNVLQVVIADISGEVVRRIDTKGGETLRISTSELASGAYTIYLMDRSGATGSSERTSVKVVVSH